MADIIVLDKMRNGIIQCIFRQQQMSIVLAVVMLDFLQERFNDVRPRSVEEIRETVVEAALQRFRPMLMSTATTVIGLMPVLMVTGRGSDVMQPMAIPSVGGMTVQIITLFIAPCLFCLAMEWEFRRGRGVDQHEGASTGSGPIAT